LLNYRARHSSILVGGKDVSK